MIIQVRDIISIFIVSIYDALPWKQRYPIDCLSYWTRHYFYIIELMVNDKSEKIDILVETKEEHTCISFI